MGEYDVYAVECFDKSIETDSYFTHAWSNKGYALISQKKYQQALDSINRATKIDPKNAHAWNYRGYAHLSLKQFDEAIKDFDKVYRDRSGEP